MNECKIIVLPQPAVTIETGYQGPPGAQGIQGPQGIQGEQGIPGEIGSDLNFFMPFAGALGGVLNVPHNLGKYPVVSVLDPLGHAIATDIKHIDLNTSSPNGATFDGDDFIQVPYAASIYTASTGSVTLGSVAAQSVANTAYIVSQNIDKRVICYSSNDEVFGQFTRYRFAASQRVLNTSEHYMATGDGANVNIYKNGILSNGTTGRTYDADANGQPLYIGRYSGGAYFTGDIHCVYLYVNNAQDANAATINTIINDILALV